MNPSENAAPGIPGLTSGFVVADGPDHSEREYLLHVAAGDKATARRLNVRSNADAADADLQNSAVICVFQIESLAEAQLASVPLASAMPAAKSRKRRL